MIGTKYVNTYKMRNLTILWIILYLICFCISIADTACLPVLTRKTTEALNRGDNEVLFCEILSCKPLTRVIYEKTDIKSPSIWTPVYEALPSSYHHALATGSDYTLHDRAEHESLDSHFLLKLWDVTVKDNGRWRCVVEDKDNVPHTSIAIPLTVVPENDVTIKSEKLELVAGQSEIFTCEINGIYPKPNFVWVLNNTKHLGNTTRNELRDDGLWYCANTVAKLDFDEPGIAVLVCTLTTHNGEPLAATNITVDIKAPAEITYLQEDRNITTYGNSPVVMTCSGSGYKPRIIWKRNGSDIPSDNHLYVSTDSDTSICTVTLTLTPIDPPLTCQKVQDFAGNYTCTVTLNPVYKSEKTSNPIEVKMLYEPLLKEQPKTVFIGESKTATLRCEVCSSTPVTSTWTFNGGLLQGHNVEHQRDGSVILTGYHPSGAYNRTVHNEFGSFSCLVDVVNTESPTYLTITYTVLFSVGFLLMLLAMWQVGKRLKSIAQWLRCHGRKLGKDNTYEMVPPGLQQCNDEESGILPPGLQQCNEGEIGIVPPGLDIQFPDSPSSDILTQTFEMEEEICSIWRSTQSDCVFIGGNKTPSITVFSFDSKQISHRLPKGTSIVYGLSMNTTTHVINVYDETLKTHSIVCVDIDSLYTTGLTVNATLELSHEIVEPRCIFAIDKSTIGIYCARKRLIGVLNIKDKRSPSRDSIIKLTGYDPDQNDSLCINPNDDICVLSYKYRNVYIHDKRGECIYTFNTGMWYDPVHIQYLDNSTLSVVNLYGEIHLFSEDSKSKIIYLREDIYVQAAVFKPTGSLLWVIDALDSTKIHVFKTDVE